MTIDVLIRTMRTRAGLSVRELASEIGVVNQSVYNWESAATDTSFARASRMIGTVLTGKEGRTSRCYT